jgi:glycosyltransferase involved in cell wall biosynthesis
MSFVDRPVGLSDILVSCLMVTMASPQRQPFVEAAIAAFGRQTHPRKELVVVYQSFDDDAGQNLLDRASALGVGDVRFVEAAPALTLGALRNISVAHAAGEVLCQWDDDDLYHPDRLSRQLTMLIDGGHDAVYLQDVMQYFPVARTMHWINWRATEDGGHAGTLMARRSTPIDYPSEGDDSRLGEDSQVARRLRGRGKVGYLVSAPHLFVYVSHGGNVWHDRHHRLLAEKLSISQGLLRRREAALRAGLQAFDFPPGTIAVTGSNGLGFML